VVRAVQDHFVAPVGQAGPPIRNAEDVVRLGCLQPARAERAQAIWPVRPVLPPGSDDYVGAGQRVDTEVSFGHVRLLHGLVRLGGIKGQDRPTACRPAIPAPGAITWAPTLAT